MTNTLIDVGAEIPIAPTVPAPLQNKKLQIPFTRTCACTGKRINCLTAKDWIKSQVAVWNFAYEKRDIRDKKKHPAVFPIAMARKVIELFSHENELVLDPFAGSGTTLLAASDSKRNAIGFDLQEKYVELAKSRLIGCNGTQHMICDDSRNAKDYIENNSVSLIFTSPPYANMLNIKRKNKSRRSDDRKNDQFDKIEQYSQDTRDLGTLEPAVFIKTITDIFQSYLPLLKPGGHCVVNITDLWVNNNRIVLHSMLMNSMIAAGYNFRNTIIWDKRALVNGVGIFGYPSNYITLGATYEYILHFMKP